MHSTDVAIVVILALFAGLGALRGFVGEFFSLLGWVAAITLGWVLSPAISRMLIHTIHDPDLRQVAAFFMIFVAVFIIVSIIGFMVRRTVVQGGAKVADHIFGAFLGVFRGIVILVVLAMLADLTSLPREWWWRSSRIVPYLQSTAHAVARYLPEKVARSLGYR